MDGFLVAFRIFDDESVSEGGSGATATSLKCFASQFAILTEKSYFKAAWLIRHTLKPSELGESDDSRCVAARC